MTRSVAVLLNLLLCQLVFGNSGRITSKPEANFPIADKPPKRGTEARLAAPIW